MEICVESGQSISNILCCILSLHIWCPYVFVAKCQNKIKPNLVLFMIIKVPMLKIEPFKKKKIHFLIMVKCQSNCCQSQNSALFFVWLFTKRFAIIVQKLFTIYIIKMFLVHSQGVSTVNAHFSIYKNAWNMLCSKLCGFFKIITSNWDSFILYTLIEIALYFNYSQSFHKQSVG